MDNQKNIIAAIALSTCVVVFYSLFFMPDQPTKKDLIVEKEKIENTETPKIKETQIIENISREDSIQSTERVIFENDNINIGVVYRN